MTVYAETSAVLSWLFSESRGPTALTTLRRASEVVTSDLTFVECHRAIHRAVFTGRLAQRSVRRTLERLDAEAAPWIVYGVGADVLRAAWNEFPHEPVRTLDAIHLATALAVRNVRPGLVLLSFDHRVVGNARALGFPAFLEASGAATSSR